MLYLCVGLVVLAVVGGGIAAVRSRGCSCGGVREGAGVLGGDGSDRAAVDPGARLSTLGFTPHRTWAAQEGGMSPFMSGIITQSTFRGGREENTDQSGTSD